MAAYYNEYEPFAAAWLRELIKAGAIADGEVSETDMWDVVPSELVRYNQVHLCAGIGGWSAALRLAGWPDDRPVWSVSLPCQPFSAAGKGAGLADERGQLADAFFWLAGVCRPVCIFGEQVEAAIKHDWLDVMASQLESIGYTVGAVGFPASSVGAYHLRQRLYWVAVANTRGLQKHELCNSDLLMRRSPARGLADAADTRREGAREHGSGPPPLPARPEQRGNTGILGDSGELGLPWGNGRRSGEKPENGCKPNFWHDAEWIYCRDGKWRAIPRSAQSETEWLVDGIPADLGLVRLERQAKGEIESEEVTVYAPLVTRGKNRVGRLRGYGNAICVPAAAEFIKAYCEIMT